MQRTPNEPLRSIILQALADKYSILDTREPNHLSSYVTCLTKCFLDQKQAAQPTEKEIMYFVTGYGLQDVLTPRDATEPILSKDGIIYRPDLMLPNIDNYPKEVKSTRKKSYNHSEPIPLTWELYMKGGCYITGTNKYDLIVIYIVQAELLCDTFEFEDYELESNWQYILSRKAVLNEALASGKPPEPYKYSYDWECKSCRYSLICELIKQNLGGKDG